VLRSAMVAVSDPESSEPAAEPTAEPAPDEPSAN
jgi:molecular chaperone GrpE